MKNQLYDVVVYGASGFVGKQVAQYLSKLQTSQAKGQTLRWAIAGRNRQRLEAVWQQLADNQPLDLLVADSCDLQAINQMVSQTQVLINTAGPFALYGTAIVDACVRLQTHYVDITGETPWVKELITHYHAQAAQDGTRIIPCCGFDSVPSDLGTFLVVQYLRNQLNQSCKTVHAYFQAQGGFNGGTLASGLNLYSSEQAKLFSDPFLLNPPDLRPDTSSEDFISPTYDTDIAAWVSSFFMGPVNTRVVRRSSALYKQWSEPYGSTFEYQEYMKFDEPLGWLKAAAMTASLGLVASAMSLELGRLLLQKLGPQPGEGPSEETMNQGWFRCELVGKSEAGQQVYGLIRDKGDPGNRATVKFLCESALCLVFNLDQLPGGAMRGGVLTPATALGEVLATRLRQTGMVIEVGPDPLR